MTLLQLHKKSVDAFNRQDAETDKSGLYKNVRRYYDIVGQMRLLGLGG